MEHFQKEKIYSQILDFKPRKSDMRRMAILDAVIDSIASQGIDNTTSQMVGKMAKMRRSHVVYYFPNREAMLEGAFKFVVATSQEIAVSYMLVAETPRDRLVQYIEAMYAWYERYPKHVSVVVLMSYYGSCQGHPAFKKLNTQIRESSEARIESILVSGKAKKGKSRGAAKKLAMDIRALLIGHMQDYFCTDKRDDYQDRKKHVIHSLLELADRYWE